MSREKSITFLREGDQFELDLFPGVPWDGRVPRALTRGRKGLFLRQEPAGHEVDPDPLQLEMWPVAARPHGKKGPDPADGAPLLMGLGRTRRGRRARFMSTLKEE